MVCFSFFFGPRPKRHVTIGSSKEAEVAGRFARQLRIPVIWNIFNSTVPLTVQFGFPRVSIHDHTLGEPGYPGKSAILVVGPWPSFLGIRSFLRPRSGRSLPSTVFLGELCPL